MSEDKERVSFSYRSQPVADTRHGVLLSWMNADTPELKREEKILDPWEAFWLAFAYEQTGVVSDEKVRRIAQSCIRRLKLQIVHIEDCFGLAHSEIPLQASVAALPREDGNGRSSLQPAALKPELNGGIGEQEEDEEEDFSTEDDILDSAF